MKSMLIKTIPLIIVSLLLLIYFNQSFGIKSLTENEVKVKENNVEFLITPEYEIYLFNQDVLIKVILINNSSSAYYIKDSFIWLSMNFEVFNSKGELIESGVSTDRVPPIDSTELKPGDEFTSIIHMGWFFENQSLYEKEIEQTYTIKANYQGIESNEILIEFKNPTGIDKELYESTSKVYNASFYPQKIDQIEALREVLYSYSDSRYAPQLYNILLLNIASYSDSAHFFDAFSKFLNTNRNSFQTYYCLSVFRNYAKNQLSWSDERINYEIDNIKNLYTGEKFSEVISSYQRVSQVSERIGKKLNLKE